MKVNTSDLAKIIGGTLYGSSDIIASELITDSRQINYTSGLAFFAINGANHDGHRFISSLHEKGVRIFVVEVIPENNESLLKDSAIILVKNTIKALQLIAAYNRKKFNGLIIAVTGSAGKTIVKEWLADIMGRTIPVLRSPKSYNSQIGVPLSVLKLEENFKAGIFEAGISQPDEMENLQKVIDPQIGIITNIGDAHGENFASLKSKAEEKLKLFTGCSAIVYCSDHKVIDSLIRKNKILRTTKLIDWSLKNDEAAIYVETIEGTNSTTRISLTHNNNKQQFTIPFRDRASVENAITAAAACLAAGIDTDTIREGLAGLVSVAWRMEIKNGINGCQLIEDFYNSDPGSLGMALEYLKSQNTRKYTLILSDFLQSGRDEKELYGDVSRLLQRSGIDKFYGIGEALERNRKLFPAGSRFFHTTDEFISRFQPSEFANEIILLKGARIYEFEKISPLLEQQVHQTVLEVNLDRISHNLNELRKYLKPGTRIMAMVKAFAYGAGPSEIASLLEYHRIDYLAVAYADEGVELREAGVSVPIVVMNPEPSAFGLMIKYNLEPEIYSTSLFTKFADIASRHGLMHYPIHIKIDSGMHRLGFMPSEIDGLVKLIRATEWLKVISVFSHLAGSEDPSLDSFTRKQVSVYTSAVDKIREATGDSFLCHILNSSGIARFPEYQFDMVRPGIGIYGVGNFPGLDLKPAGCFRTRISQIKPIPAGEPVGYGCADVSEKERVIGILPVGYADGLSRKLGNGRGSLFIKGRMVPIVGNVCMDMCMADITGLDANEGDEAEIFGDNIRVDDMAAKCETIPYEVLTSIPARVKRIFYRE